MITLNGSNIKATIEYNNSCFLLKDYIGNIDLSILIKEINKVFRLSSNNIKVDSYLGYEVYLDLDTNFKHYFKNNIEDYTLFYFNNGYSLIAFKGVGIYDRMRGFRIANGPLKGVIIGVSLSLFIVLGSLFISNITNKDSNTPTLNGISISYVTDSKDITLSEIKESIFSSPFLNSIEKEYLYNESFFKDLLQVINTDNYSKEAFRGFIHAIEIKPYGEDNHLYDSTLGYYTPSDKSSINIRDYSCITPENADTVAHEFVHLCQNNNYYNLITEASAEIISYEYYNQTSMNNYPVQVKLLKKLMEIIGYEPIWYYNFTGDFTLIEKSVKPFLSSEEYELFINCLTFNTLEDADNNEKAAKLNELLGILYESINGKNIDNDSVIPLIGKDTQKTHRYYFNSSKRNQSFYFDSSTVEEINMPIEDAMSKGLMVVKAQYKRQISVYEALLLFNIKGINIIREIDFNDENIKIQNVEYDTNGIFFTGTINGKKFDNVSIDLLALRGYVKCKYYLKTSFLVSYDEYMNIKDEMECTISFIGNLTIRDNNVIGTSPGMVALPPVNRTILDNSKTLKQPICY